MLDTHGRKYVEPIIRAGADQLVEWGLSPNQATGLAFISGISVGPIYLMGWTYIAVAMLWISGYLDAVDGSMARRTGKTSKLGTLMDILFDRVVECGVIIAIAYAHPEANMAIVMLLCAIILSMTIFLTTGALTPNDGVKSFRYQAGIAERTEGFVMITMMLVLRDHIVVVSGLFCLMVMITVLQRFVEASKLLR